MVLDLNRFSVSYLWLQIESHPRELPIQGRLAHGHKGPLQETRVSGFRPPLYLGTVRPNNKLLLIMSQSNYVIKT